MNEIANEKLARIKQLIGEVSSKYPQVERVLKQIEVVAIAHNEEHLPPKEMEGWELEFKVLFVLKKLELSVINQLQASGAGKEYMKVIDAALKTVQEIDAATEDGKRLEKEFTDNVVASLNAHLESIRDDIEAERKFAS
ncbi:hypothetical protein JW868_04575 [Candidatus Woesearchaeota archaeon]|nr:hypothetical protein [Candidatus Woesearchaeota archaeon]